MFTGLLHEGLEYWRRQTPTKRAVVLDGAESLTYEELGRWSDGVAARLQASGVVAGDTVAICGANSIAWIVGAFAILKAGGVLVPVNERYTAPEITYLLETSEPRLVLADAERAATIAGCVPSVPVIRLDALEPFRAGASADWRAVEQPSSAIAIVIFTSGTTAQPKGVMLAHDRHLAKFAEMCLFAPELGPATQSLMPFGLQAGPGTAWGYLFATTIGGTFHFTSKYDAERTLRTLVDERISFFIGVPMIYEQIARLPAFADADLSALAFARVGGARSHEETLAAWRARGVIVRNLYGMSEMGGGAIIATADEALARPESCGRGMPYTRVRCVRDDGTECAAGEAGAVLMRGPGQMVGYWRNSDATAEAVIDGWMHSGDIGVIDAEGYFTFLDRSKEMIKSGGFNISPSEIEGVIAAFDGVVEVSVFSVPDDKFGEVPFACVHAADPIDPQAVFEACRQRLAGFKLPRYVVASRDPLARLTNGKFDKRRMKADYADARDRFPRLG
ncbi:fatty-acyl-CoA synthase [Sphingomonas jinjuensis]|uniref:Fatty-acyl-CoA synthase n=1 Tax=Sphingomonas jinjuensis TaxID=535907 RepID=A0A840FNT5_9SPHN|nr:AMP-binding protein [Sphingomonas jinjuensis]MBB4155548.1 fatty-acyl-CoA synthase [Sphingomonas jinjuensis]